MKNEYYDTLDLKPNGNILEMYRNRNRYVPDAQDAIIDILKKRGLYEQALEEEEKEEIEQEKIETETIKDFERKVFGDHSSNIEFAQKSLQGNEYFKAVFSTVQKSFHFSSLALIIGILGVASLFIFFITNEYKIDLILYWALPSLLSSLFLILGIKGRKSAQSIVTLHRKSNEQIDLTIQMKENEIIINYPFKYEYYWTYIQNVKPRLKQVTLFILIYKHDEMVICLNETLDASKNPPPHWNYLQNEKNIKGSKFLFTNYGFQSPNLYKLQKILDGIKEQH